MDDIDSFFRQAARRDPRGIAIEDEAGFLSWAELDLLANKVANKLRYIGVGRGDNVAVAGESNKITLAAIVGIARAGACMLSMPLEKPVGSDEPRTNWATLLNETEAKVMFLSENQVPRLRQCFPELRYINRERVVVLEGQDKENSQLFADLNYFVSGVPISLPEALVTDDALFYLEAGSGQHETRKSFTYRCWALAKANTLNRLHCGLVARPLLDTGSLLFSLAMLMFGARVYVVGHFTCSELLRVCRRTDVSDLLLSVEQVRKLLNWPALKKEGRGMMEGKRIFTANEDLSEFAEQIKSEWNRDYEHVVCADVCRSDAKTN